MELKYEVIDGKKCVIVPINVCYEVQHITLSLDIATKRVKVKGGDIKFVSYPIKDKEIENCVIGYYNSLVVGDMLRKFYHTYEVRSALGYLENAPWEDMFERLGIVYNNSHYYNSLHGQIKEIIDKYSDSTAELWLCKYIDKCLGLRDIAKNFSIESLSDAALVFEFTGGSEKEIRSQIEEMLNDENYYSLLINKLFIPYLKSKKQAEENRLKKIEELENKLKKKYEEICDIKCNIDKLKR